MTDANRIPDWIAVDWGTSRLRAWAMSASGEVLDTASSDDGMGRLTSDAFEPALRALTGSWLPAGGLASVPVIACGMVGARQGWVEAAYGRVPCPPLGPDLTRAPGTMDVRIIAGLSQASPPDVMRGEETQIAGLIALRPGWDGVVCLPGTHSKWAEISAGEVVSFRSFMTGELYAALAEHSVLRHSLTAEETEVAAFDAAVSETLSRPERLAGGLFGIRAAGLLDGLEPRAARGRLSGLLIGAELAAAKPYWLGREVALIGAGPLAALYARALTAQGVPAEAFDATDTTLAGLTAAWKDQQ
ncbi:2-dehydro-3-deoxygalactonokinase [Pseudoroseicyclus aestuarii]|uniref:2-keto-3-deoxygalactonate kinase n=1 Tax=Pseudoroseicyclus aestuarii TaxID=1795041 RepID=A0A318SVG5_9RHOB|nr:2-dehydro-3-deoxygalactonokinase [Pseudoroseicyclus aestuarii]PYE85901.1 2-keto-3-deoxygalactonate kinase [Pseudoroseicyclus aestuarii]